MLRGLVSESTAQHSRNQMNGGDVGSETTCGERRRLQSLSTDGASIVKSQIDFRIKINRTIPFNLLVVDKASDRLKEEMCFGKKL